MRDKLLLGTRGSELARIQTGMVETALQSRWPELEIERRIIGTRGDQGAFVSTDKDVPAGGKGLFTREIEQVLIDGGIDGAVHSAKDLPSELTIGTIIAAVLPRAAADDILLSLGNYTIATLPERAVVATGSIRRRYQLQWQRPDLEIVPLRGNVPTRLRRLLSGTWHGAILARAGLERLGLQVNGACALFENSAIFLHPLPQHIFLPAGGQGVIAMQTREPDETTKTMFAAITDEYTQLCLGAERTFLRLLQADCNQPVAVLARIEQRTMAIRAQIFSAAAANPREAEVTGNFQDGEELAKQLFQEINAG